LGAVPGSTWASIVVRKKPPAGRIFVPAGHVQRTSVPPFIITAGEPALSARKPAGSRSSTRSRLVEEPKLNTVIV